MQFDDNAALDTTQVADRRSGFGGSFGRAPVAVGGTGIVAVVVYLLFSLVSGTGPIAGDGSGLQLGQGTETDLSASCRTGADANQSQDCRIVGVVNSVQSYWRGSLGSYQQAPTVLFSGRTTTGCGAATSAVGPFYCPADESVYLDLEFFGELHDRFGAKGGPFAEAYVVAHEYGHHVQRLTGQDQQVGRDRDGPQSGSVRLELQADCFAGVWTAHATQTGFIEDLSTEDIAVGLDAAASVGDDRIQQAATGRIDPERFTHGTAEQRQRWFSHGYDAADPAACDTFNATSL